ncbi:hypothetical protein CsSME_00037728 [Camellia sinensis var. sinensis]
MSMAMAQRLAQLGEEIERVENQLRECQRLLFAFWQYLPKDQIIREAELRLQMLRAALHSLILSLALWFRREHRAEIARLIAATAELKSLNHLTCLVVRRILLRKDRVLLGLYHTESIRAHERTYAQVLETIDGQSSDCGFAESNCKTNVDCVKLCRNQFSCLQLNLYVSNTLGGTPCCRIGAHSSVP